MTFLDRPVSMGSTYDPEVDAAYLRLTDTIAAGEAVQQIEVAWAGLAGTVVLDVDAHGRLLGMEILNARSVLRPDFLVRLTSAT